VHEFRRMKLFVLAVAAALLLAAPGSASGAVTLGSTFTATEGCVAGATYSQTSSSGNSYVMPTDGVITSWAHRAGAGPPDLKFRIVRQVAETNYFKLVREAPWTPQTANQLNEFPVRIPVKGGDMIGLVVGPSMAPYNCSSATGKAADVWYFTTLDYFEIPFVGPGLGFKFDVSAQLEPDADGDGFGDETQDLCPTMASTQGGCPVPLIDTDPPETTITKRAPNKTEKRRVTFQFRSDEAGSTFECKLDKTPFKSCSSPKKLKGLAEGAHVFKVRAKDPAGNADPSPAKDQFKVVD
jgi:hypothetical protein